MRPLTGFSKVLMLTTQDRLPGLTRRAAGVSLLSPSVRSWRESLSWPLSGWKGSLGADRSALRPAPKGRQRRAVCTSWRFRRYRSRMRECTCRAGMKLSRSPEQFFPVHPIGLGKGRNISHSKNFLYFFSQAGNSIDYSHLLHPIHFCNLLAGVALYTH